MVDRKMKNDRFLSAYEYLFNEGKVSSKKDLADQIGVSQNTISRIAQYDVTVSNETIYKLNSTFGNIFNMDYFLGKSFCMLKADAEHFKDDPKHQWLVNPYPDKSTQESTQINKDVEVNTVIKAYEKEIERLREKIQDKLDVIEAQKHTIALQERTITELNRRLQKYEADDILKDFPFAPGVSDKKDQTKNV